MDNQIVKVEKLDIKLDAGDLTKPADTLIAKISEALGGYFEPWQKRRLARANADVARINAESQIEVTDIQRRAMLRWVAEEGARQANIERITEQAIPLLGQNAAPQNLESDWITNFFDKARVVSDTDMQQLWSRILAGEATAPGTFAKRTVNVLGELDKSDALLFESLCGFVWNFGTGVPLIQDFSYEPIVTRGITFESLGHLDALGLIKFVAVPHFALTFPPHQIIVTAYFGKTVFLTPGDLDAGMVILTRAGQQLCRICDAKPVDGYFEHMLKVWGPRASVPGLPKDSVTEVAPSNA